MKTLLVLALVTFVKYSECSNDYYWRDYEPSFTAKIPIDAVVAGKDITEEKVYVGQTNHWGVSGIHPGTILQGQDVWVHAGGVRKATKFIQILCSQHPENFKWVPATSTNLHLVGINTHVVRGGFDNDHLTYVGRVKHQGRVIVGKVWTNDVNNSEMVFVFDNREYRVKSYEVLTYDVNKKHSDPEPSAPNYYQHI